MRTMVVLTAAVALLGVLADDVPRPQQIAPGIAMIPGSFAPKREPDGNTVIFDAPDGLIVMDSGRHPWHRRAILDYANARGKPIAAIINSHWHLDHVSGNPDIRAAIPASRSMPAAR